MITSLQNKRVKEAIKLRRRAGRDEQNRFFIDGLREIQQALSAGIPLLEAFVCRSLQTAVAVELQAKLPNRIEICEVAKPVWEKLSYGNRRDGLMLIARHVPRDLGSLDICGRLPIVVLDQVEKPGNVGAIFRSAAAAGVAAIIAADARTDLYNPNAIRASLGSVFRVPWAAATAAETIDRLRQQQLPIYVAHLSAATSYLEADLSGDCAIVLGSEAKGVSGIWDHGPSITHIRIPMQENLVDSLNVANTAAILLYEARRQRELVQARGAKAC